MAVSFIVSADHAYRLTFEQLVYFYAIVANVPVEKACGLLYNVNLSIRQYEEIRLALLPYNISLPTKNAVIDFKSTLYPKGILASEVNI